MKKRTRQKKTDVIVFIITTVLFAALMVITGYLVVLFNKNTSESKIPFNLDSITLSGSSTVPEDFEDLLLPEFIGIKLGEEQRGVSGSVNVMTDVYSSFAQTISSVMQKENCTPSTLNEWNAFSTETNLVYVRYHSQMPDIVIGMFADISADRSENRTEVSSYVYEMFIIPEDKLGTGETIAVRDHDGHVFIYRNQRSEDHVSTAQLSKHLQTYSSQFRKFEFADSLISDKYSTDPVFVESVSTRNIFMTNEIASLAYGNTIKTLMRVFRVNPDKLLTSHEGEDGTASYTDRSGVFYHYESAFEYKASEDGGIDISDIIGYSERNGLKEYLSAAKILFDEVKNINPNYTGAEADIYLSSVKSDGRVVELTFNYAYDNIRIADIEPAFIVSFKDGKIIGARLYTLMVTNVSTRNTPKSEWWFFDYIENDGRDVYNVGLVYRSDFVTEKVVAEWSAVVNDKSARYR